MFFIKNLKSLDKELTLAICGKYTALEDSYASILEAITHCMAHTKTKVTIRMIETTDIKSEADIKKKLEGVESFIKRESYRNHLFHVQIPSLIP